MFKLIACRIDRVDERLHREVRVQDAINTIKVLSMASMSTGVQYISMDTLVRILIEDPGRMSTEFILEEERKREGGIIDILHVDEVVEFLRGSGVERIPIGFIVFRFKMKEIELPQLPDPDQLRAELDEMARTPEGRELIAGLGQLVRHTGQLLALASQPGLPGVREAMKRGGGLALARPGEMDLVRKLMAEHGEGQDPHQELGSDGSKGEDPLAALAGIPDEGDPFASMDTVQGSGPGAGPLSALDALRDGGSDLLATPGAPGTSPSVMRQVGPLQMLSELGIPVPAGASRSDPLTEVYALNLYNLYYQFMGMIGQGRAAMGLPSIDTSPVEERLRARSIFLLMLRGHHIREEICDPVLGLGYNCLPLQGGEVQFLDTLQTLYIELVKKNTSQFFRYPVMFEKFYHLFEGELLELARERARGDSEEPRKIRILDVGISTGEEPLTIVLLAAVCLERNRKRLARQLGVSVHNILDFFGISTNSLT